MSRLSIDAYMMSIALVTATRSTCRKRQVGAVLTNKHNHIVATGYNGEPPGALHCIDSPCVKAQRAGDTDFNLELVKCETIHAEANALMQCKNNKEAKTLYITRSPCVDCMLLLTVSGVERIIYLTQHSNENALRIWEENGGKAEAWKNFSQFRAITDVFAGIQLDIAQLIPESIR